MTGAPIYVVGDSTADHFSEAIIAAGEALGRPVSISTTNACPFIDPSLASSAAPARITKQCQDFVAGTLDYLLSAPPGLVIMSSSDGYWSDPSISVSGADLASALEATITRLEDAGQTVLVVQSVPRWTGSNAWSPAECTLVTVIADDCRASMRVEDVDEKQRIVHETIAAIAARTGSDLLDTWPLMCPDGTCETQIPGLVRYRDPTHITVDQSTALTEEFAEAIRAAG